MPSNLIHMALDSLLEGEPPSVVVERVLRVAERTWKKNTGPSGATGFGESLSKELSPSERGKNLLQRILREQTSGTSGGTTGPSGTTGGATGGNGGATNGGTNGTTTNGQQDGDDKLQGKGIKHGLHLAYAPDYCASKYTPGTAAYRKCRSKKDKTEGLLHEISLNTHIEMRLEFKGGFHNYGPYIILLGLTDTEGVKKFFKSLRLKGISDIEIVKDKARSKTIVWKVDSRNNAKTQIDRIAIDIAENYGEMLGKSKASVSIYASEWAKTPQGSNPIWQDRQVISEALISESRSGKMSTYIVWRTRDPSNTRKIRATSAIAAREKGADIFRAPRWEISAKNLDEEEERKKNTKYPWVDPPYWRP